jgi:hypothetical protein
VKLKVFTLAFSDSAGGFDDGHLQEFIADKEVIEYTEHFFVHERTPYLTLVLAYRGISDDRRRRPVSTPDFRAELDGSEREAFDALKAWRAARAMAQDSVASSGGRVPGLPGGDPHGPARVAALPPEGPGSMERTFLRRYR